MRISISRQLDDTRNGPKAGDLLVTNLDGALYTCKAHHSAEDPASGDGFYPVGEPLGLFPGVC